VKEENKRKLEKPYYKKTPWEAGDKTGAKAATIKRGSVRKKKK